MFSIREFSYRTNLLNRYNHAIVIIYYCPDAATSPPANVFLLVSSSCGPYVYRQGYYLYAHGTFLYSHIRRVDVVILKNRDISYRIPTAFIYSRCVLLWNVDLIGRVVIMHDYLDDLWMSAKRVGQWQQAYRAYLPTRMARFRFMGKHRLK